MTKVLNYTVLFQKAEEGGYIAFVPMLPGCMTQAETFEDAQKQIKDAIAAYIEVLKEDDEFIPIESDEHIAATIGVPVTI